MKALTLLIGTALLNVTAAGQDEMIDASPEWTAGGHYTAELNLSTSTLTLMPLNTVTDEVLALPDACAAGKIEAGVYVLKSSAAGWTLVATHPRGAPVRTGPDSYALLDCADSTTGDSLKLPTAALTALRDSSVGALYVRYE